MAFNRTLAHFTSSQELATEWASGQSYIAGQLVIESNALYKCLIGHTSALSFATDLAAGKWIAISSSESGVRNYIENPNFNAGSVAGWSLFNTTLTSKIPTGSITAGAASITSFVADATTPIEGAFDLLVGSSGAITAGHGFISDVFTIEREDQSRVLGFSFSYEAISGTMDFSGTSNNTWAVYIYDVSNSAWIQPAGVYNLVQGSGIGIASGSFQTTATGTQYRIAVVCVTATSGAVQMRFDDFQLGPQSTVQGAAISDWTSFSPTLNTPIANSNTTGKYRRVGDTIEAVVYTDITGAPGAFGSYTVNISSIGSIDTSKLPSMDGEAVLLGTVRVSRGGASQYNGFIHYQSPTLVVARVQTTTTVTALGSGYLIQDASITNAVPLAFQNGDNICAEFRFPAAGLSSNTVLSQDTDTRVVAARMIRGTTQALVTGDNKILLSSATFDTHAAFDAVNSRYIAPVSGYYEISASIEAQGSATADLGFGYRLNGSGAGTTIYCGSDAAAPAAPSTFINGNDSVFLNAGSYIEFYQYISSATGTLGTRSKISVKRLSGPATIAASESVVEIRENLAGTTINPGFTKIPYISLVKSTHSAWDLANSRFISPVSGTYQITFLYQHIYNVPGSQRPFELAIRKNGSSDILFPYRTSIQTSTDGSYGDRYAACLSATTQLNAGEYIEFYSSSANGSVNLYVQNGTNRISIFRIGN